MKTPVIIGIATIEARKESLVDTLDSLKGQCDRIYVYLNDYIECSTNDDIIFCGTDLSESDIGDIGKFKPLIDHWSYGVPTFGMREGSWDLIKRDDPDAFFLVCDDDLIYPPDYVETLIAGIERHDRKAVVGFHGKVYYSPVVSYYRSFAGSLECNMAFNYRCLDEVKPPTSEYFNDYPATVIGTGCTGWHSSLFKDNPLSMDDFRHPNMADIWFSKKCNDLSIPRYVIPHEAGWINHTIKIDMRETIASRYRDDDAIQTKVFNSVEWKL